MQAESIYFKLTSVLLAYPDDAYLGMLTEIRSAADRLPTGRPKAAIEAFVQDLGSRHCLELQERYTALFDTSPATTLNMTYHLLGDGEKRAGLLTRLQQLYTYAGFERSSTELPDFLPLMLEFMAAVPDARESKAIRRCMQALAPLVERLADSEPPYAALLGPLVEMFGDCGAQRAAAGAV